VREERRRSIRRQADRDLTQRFQALQAQASEQDSRDLRHKRRHAIRHNCRVHIALKIGHSVGRGPLDTWTVSEFPLKGRILDLSAEGCSVFCGQQLDVGSELNLIIALRDNAQIKTNGIVRWNKGIRQHNGYACGVQFQRIQEADRRRIQAFLEELDETAGL